MATTTKIFDYTGTVQFFTIPAGTNTVDMYLWGGAGGGGGGDAAGPGRSGAAGHFVSKTSFDLSSYTDTTMEVGVGGGGAGGSGGGNAPGGTNGKSITGFSGGTGGRSGPNGSSGAGGGGGGATLIRINGTVVATAGGGGGGAGDGKSSQGTNGVNANSQTATGSPASLGERGANHNGDGGGGGAGGGGDTGGKGGNGGSGDNGGTGGYSGGDLIPAGGSNSVGSGTTPGGTGNANYSGSIAVGGSAGSSGGNGRAVLIFSSDVGSKTKVGGTWKDITDSFVKVGGTWKRITSGYVKIGGTWKALFGTVGGHDGSGFQQTATGFGGVGSSDALDGSGGAGSSGSAGSGGGGGGRVICTWLMYKDMFSAEDLKIDTEFSVKYLPRTLKIGYWYWAVPLVRYMDKAYKENTRFGKIVISVIRTLAQARANELSYKMGYRKKGDILGKITRFLGEGFCYAVGLVVRPFAEKRFGQWLEIYDPDIN